MVSSIAVAESDALFFLLFYTFFTLLHFFTVLHFFFFY